MPTLFLGLGVIESVIAIIAGFLAAFINTLAGYGSIISLVVLDELLGNAKSANASNRIGILAAAIVGAWTFRKGGSLKLQGVGWLVVPAVLGSVVGSYIAVELDEWLMTIVIIAIMLVMLALLRPERWLKKDSQLAGDGRRLATVAIFFLIGMYGGFIQVGVGILLLAGLVLFTGYNMAEGNAVKVLITLCFTIPALTIFARSKDMTGDAWTAGSVMAVGQVAGAFVAARFASRHPKANIWVRRLLIVMIIVGIAKLGYELAYPRQRPETNPVPQQVREPEPGRTHPLPV